MQFCIRFSLLVNFRPLAKPCLSTSYSCTSRRVSVAWMRRSSPANGDWPSCRAAVARCSAKVAQILQQFYGQLGDDRHQHRGGGRKSFTCCSGQMCGSASLSVPSRRPVSIAGNRQYVHSAARQGFCSLMMAAQAEAGLNDYGNRVQRDDVIRRLQSK